MSNICHQKTRKITQQLLNEVRGELNNAPHQEREDTRRIPTQLLEMIRLDADKAHNTHPHANSQASEVEVNFEEMLRLSILGQPAEEDHEHDGSDLFSGLGTELDNLLQHSLFPTDSGAMARRKPELDLEEDAPGAMWVNKPISPPPSRHKSSSTDMHPRLNMSEDQPENTSSINALLKNTEPSASGWSIDLSGVLEEHNKDASDDALDLAGILEKHSKNSSNENLNLDEELDEEALMALGSAPMDPLPIEPPTTETKVSYTNTKASAPVHNTGDMEVFQSPPPSQILKKKMARSITGAMKAIHAQEAAASIRPRRALPSDNRTSQVVVPPSNTPNDKKDSWNSISASKLEMLSSQPYMQPMQPNKQAPTEEIIGTEPSLKAVTNNSPTVSRPSMVGMQAVQAVQAAQEELQQAAPALRSLLNFGTLTGAIMILLAVIPLANIKGGWPLSPWIAAVPLLCGTWFLAANAMNASLNIRRIGFVGVGGLFFSFCVAPALLHFMNVTPAIMAGLPHLLLITLLAGVLPLRANK